MAAFFFGTVSAQRYDKVLTACLMFCAIALLLFLRCSLKGAGVFRWASIAGALVSILVAVDAILRLSLSMRLADIF